jgi:hypothetical protein
MVPAKIGGIVPLFHQWKDLWRLLDGWTKSFIYLVAVHDIKAFPLIS